VDHLWSLHFPLASKKLLESTCCYSS